MKDIIICPDCKEPWEGKRSFASHWGRSHDGPIPDDIDTSYGPEDAPWLGKTGEEHPKTGVAESEDANLARSEAMKGENNPAWKGGREHIKTHEAPGLTGTVKEEIRNRDQRRCQAVGCGMTEPEHLEKWNERLHVHHIDEDRMNNDETNLVTLCATCHQSIDWIDIEVLQ